MDADGSAMGQASRRAAARGERGGLSNACFVVSRLERFPPGLEGHADLVTVHFPWGSLLRAAAGREPGLTALVAGLVRAGGALRLLLSASPRDGRSGIDELDLSGLIRAYRRLGFEVSDLRPATIDDAVVAGSTWGKRLLRSPGGRSAWYVELARPVRDPAPSIP
jgi:16S rRNA (adenine(1408)-N(1))-methyltransferase